MQNQLFKLAKSISLGISGLLLLLIIYLCYSVFFSGESIEKPSFKSDFKSEVDSYFKITDTSNQNSSANETDKFITDFFTLCRDYNVPEEEIGTIAKETYLIHKEDQKDFLEELKVMLKEVREYSNDNKLNITGYGYFIKPFIQKYSTYKIESSFKHKITQTDKMLSIFVLITCIFLFITFILVPVIIQVEENTRK